MTKIAMSLPKATGRPQHVNTTLFALFLVDEVGVEWFAGGYKTWEAAEQKARPTGKKYFIREVEV
jgi:hypothetical protein